MKIMRFFKNKKGFEMSMQLLIKVVLLLALLGVIVLFLIWAKNYFGNVDISGL